MSRYRKLFLLTLMIMIMSASLVTAVNQRGDLTSFFRTINVSEDTLINGNVVAIFGDINIHGEVTGNVASIFGKTYIDGIVAGDTVSIFGGITIAHTGIVYGDATAILGHGIENRGIIRQEEISILGIIPKHVSILRMIFLLIFFSILAKQFFALVISVITVLIFGERFDRMAAGAQQEVGKKLLVGLLVYFGALIGFSILIMTVIGAPVALLLIPVVLILGFLGNTTIKVTIGRKMASHFNKSWSLLMELLAGTLVFLLLEATIVGHLITFALKLIGIGELLDSRFGDEIKKDLI